MIDPLLTTPSWTGDGGQLNALFGWAVGGGMNISAACDFRIAAKGDGITASGRYAWGAA